MSTQGRGIGNTADYEADFYGWAMEQARLLRAGRLTEADIENIAEEIESMGRSQKSELVSRLSGILLHLCSNGSSSPAYAAKAGVWAS